MTDVVKNFNFLFTGAKSASQSEVNRNLEMGRDYLARGQLADALTHYHAAVGMFHFPPTIFIFYLKHK